ncbi:hypothetical protein E2562_036671 [Oryza meyeriana var. granulata]|uniref:Uncharacterized protein n=1 Tax=Oryza meyeriana var. granulata TaxID=110450 RepID=A0A6G1FG74_9ORYZ|nr:hypothetical protein E2562_036671 [Oryza meyeriana var. granulata]
MADTSYGYDSLLGLSLGGCDEKTHGSLGSATRPLGSMIPSLVYRHRHLSCPSTLPPPPARISFSAASAFASFVVPPCNLSHLPLRGVGPVRDTRGGRDACCLHQRACLGQLAPSPSVVPAWCEKSYRLRWSNYLWPDIKRGHFSFEEEAII